MQRTTGANAYPAGMFSDGDPTIPRPPTQLTKEWFNQIQEEIIALIAAAGLTPDATAQLGAVIANLTTAQTFAALKTFGAGLRANAVEAGPQGRGAARLIGSASYAALEAVGQSGSTALDVSGGTSYFESDDANHTAVFRNTGTGAALEVQGTLAHPGVAKARGSLSWNNGVYTVGPGSFGFSGATTVGYTILPTWVGAPDSSKICVFGSGRGLNSPFVVLQADDAIAQPGTIKIWSLSAGGQVDPAHSQGTIDLVAFW